MIIDILRHTPLRIFGIFFARVVLGLQRLRARDVTTRQLLILPVVMALLSLAGLYQSFGASAIAASGWIIAVSVSLLFARVRPPQDGVQYSSATRRIRVPDSWVPLVPMMTIFFLRDGAAANLSMRPALRTALPFIATIGFAYGLSSGLFAARALRIWNTAFRRSAPADVIGSAA